MTTKVAKPPILFHRSCHPQPLEQEQHRLTTSMSKLAAVTLPQPPLLPPSFASHTRKGDPPILSLKLANISKLSQEGPEALSDLWYIFSKCSDSLQDGRRLENLSWRLWYEDLSRRSTTASGEDALTSRVDSADSTPLSDQGSDFTDDDSDEDSDVHDDDEVGAAGQTSKSLPVGISSDPLRPAMGARASVSSQAFAAGNLTKEDTSARIPLSSGDLVSPSAEQGSPSLPLESTGSQQARATESTSAAGTATAVTKQDAGETRPIIGKQPPILLQPQPPSSSHRRSSFPPLQIKQTQSKPRRPSHHTTRSTSSHAENGIVNHPSGSAVRIRTQSTLTPFSLQKIIGAVVPTSGQETSAANTPVLSSSNLAAVPPLSFSTSPAASSRTVPAPITVAAFASAAPNRLPSTSPHSTLKSTATTMTAATTQPSSVQDSALPPVTPTTAASADTSTTTPSTSAAYPTPTSAAPAKPVRPVLVSKHSSSAVSSNSTSGTDLSGTASGGAGTRGVRSNSSGIGSDGRRSSIKRSQSSKSVRILESPTFEGTRNPSEASASPRLASALRSPVLMSTSTSSNHSHHGMKRVPSSTRVRHVVHHHHGVRNSTMNHPHRSASSSNVAAGAGVGSLNATPSHASNGSSAARGVPMKRHYSGPTGQNVAGAAMAAVDALNGHTARRQEEIVQVSPTAPKSYTRGFELPPPVAAATPPTTGLPIIRDANTVTSGSSDMPQPPPPSPASPVMVLPSSVVLPRQPMPTPSDAQYRTYSSIKRPISPPFSNSSQSQTTGAGSSLLTSVSDGARTNLPTPASQSQATHISKTGNESQTRQQVAKDAQQVAKDAHKSAEGLAGPAQRNGVASVPPKTPGPPHQQHQRRSQTVPAQSRIANATEEAAACQGTAAKKGKMFFFSSPQTDSDDEAFGTSVGRKKALQSPASLAAHNSLKNSGYFSSSHGAAAAPTLASTAAAAKATSPQRKDKTTVAEAPVSEEHSDEEDFEDDDEDDSDWSSETSESEGEELRIAEAARRRRLAIEKAREEERQRQMFAKRVPSQVHLEVEERGGGLLSQLLHPENYPRNFQNLPTNLRNNKSAVELQRARPSDTALIGLDVVSNRNNHQFLSRATHASAANKNRDGNGLMVTGLQSSKSAAALHQLNRAGPSTNRLTRLGGAPADVELESDDSDDDEENDHRNYQPLRALSHGRDGSSGRVSETSGRASTPMSSEKQTQDGPAPGRTSSSSTRSRSRDFSAAQQERLASLLHKRTNSATNLLKTAPSSTSVTTSVVIAPEPLQVPASTAAANTNGVGQAFTPRTTRRNMLATELTESLRMNLIWERQSRIHTSKGAIAGLGGMVAAGVNRLTGKNQPQTTQNSRPSDAQQAQASAHGSNAQPPRIQRGSSTFQAQTNDTSVTQDGANQRQEYTLPARPPANSKSQRRNSDSSTHTNQDYYSPGFHHVGW